MSALSRELVVDGFGRLQAPCIDDEGRLCFSDMLSPGGVFRLEADGSVTSFGEREHVGGLSRTWTVACWPHESERDPLTC